MEVENLENIIEEIKEEICLLKQKDDLEKWLIKEIKFAYQINFWYCFFKINIKFIKF